MIRLVKIRYRNFTAAEEKNNKCGTHWGLTGGKTSLFLLLNGIRSITRSVLISPRYVDRGLHISHDQSSQIVCLAQEKYSETVA